MISKPMPTSVKPPGHQHLGLTAITNGMTNFRIRFRFSKGAVNNATGQQVFYSMDPDLVNTNIQLKICRDCQLTVTTELSFRELLHG